MSLSIDYTTLRREIGYFIGYKSSTTDWSAAESTRVDDIINSGLRRFYWPAAIGEEKPHIWSFIAPNGALNLVSGEYIYRLPEGFTDLESKGFTYSSGSGVARCARVTNETISVLRAQASRSGAPQFFALQTVKTDEGLDAGYDVLFYPTPDATYSLSYTYSLTPKSLSTDSPYPLGGARHSETIKEACLAEAEKKQFDEYGQHEKRFQELLAASIAADKSLAKPEVQEVWPYENPANGLTVNKAYLKRLIGETLGYGPHPGLWDYTQAQKVKLALETGLRKFYAPPVLPNERFAYNWSFLKTIVKLTMVEDQVAYDLPEGFAMLSGDEILYEPGNYSLYEPIKLVSERQVTYFQQNQIAAGMPKLAAYRVRPQDENGVRYELIFWPTPDDAYVVNVRYTMNPGMMSDENSLPYATQSGMQALIEACLSACEEMQGQRGLHSELFIEALRAAVGEDRKVNSPDTLGFNIDRSDLPQDPRAYNWHGCNNNIVTYNGIQY